MFVFLKFTMQGPPFCFEIPDYGELHKALEVVEAALSGIGKRGVRDTDKLKALGLRQSVKARC